MERVSRWGPIIAVLCVMTIPPGAWGRAAECGTATDALGALVSETRNLACDDVASWTFGSVRVRVLNREAGAAFLQRPDAFTQSMSAFDLQARMPWAEAPTESDYLTFAGRNTLDWEPEELDHLKQAVERFMTLTANFNLPLPPEILFIKSRAGEEFKAAYTRGHAVVLPLQVTRSAEETETFVDHEIYHVATRHSPAFRKDMAKLLGFTPTDVAPESLPQRSVTNPDRGRQRWRFRQLTPVLYSKYDARDVRSVYAFRYGLAVLGDDDHVIHDGGGRFVEVHPDMIHFHDDIGVPRTFPLDPEELMARTFEVVLDTLDTESAVRTLTRPALMDEILASPWFLGFHTSHYGTRYPNATLAPLPDHELFGDRGPLSWEQASAVAERLSGLFQSYATETGKSLEIELHWLDEWDQASAHNPSFSQKMSVTIGGRLARNPMMTQDTLAKIACHELGHLFGGAPVRVSPMKEPNSVELQADYWSTAKCLRRYFAVEGDANLTWVDEHPVQGHVRRECSRQFEDDLEAAVCMRSSMAALNEVRMLEHLSSKSKQSASFSTPSRKRVSLIERYYADNQCRLDTLFQGALCAESAETRVSQTDAEQGVCSRSKGDVVGVRPRCWYQPGAEVQRMGGTAY